MKKFLLSMVALLLVSFLVFVSPNKIEANELDIYDYDAVSNLMKKNKSTRHMLYRTFEKEKTFEYDEYIDNYAGSFVRDGKLFMLKTNKQTTLATYGLNNNVQENIVKFSMNQLNDTMNDINLYKKYNGDTYIAKQFNFYWIDVENNRIVVEFDELNDFNVNLFKKNVLDSECIVFKQIKAQPKEEVSVYPGSKIIVRSSGSSVGYRATRNGVKGLVISGHAGSVGDKVYSNGSLIGTIESVKYYGPVDAAFLRTNSNDILSNSVYGGVLSNNVQNLNVGVNVFKIGASTGTTSGRVTKNNVTVTFNNVSFFGLVGANYKSDPGDSGGLVFFKVPGQNLINTVGIHKGTVGETRIYSKASEVNKALGLRRY